MADDVTVRNAYFDIDAIFNLNIRFAMGTTLFSHLIIMQFGQLKSNCSVSG